MLLMLKRRCEDAVIYTKGIVCQGPTIKGLLNVEMATIPMLMMVMMAQQDEPFRRVHKVSYMEA